MGTKPLAKKIMICVALCFIAWGNAVYAQMLSIDTSFTAKELVFDVLMGRNNDLLIRNVKYTGSNKSIGAFVNDLPEELIDAGIILSTGNVFDAQGPNNAVNVGTKSSARRDQDLQAIATSVTTDAAVLEFDLIALRDSLSFEFIFASEEYPEYVNKGVNDVFGFFIKEVGSKAIYPRNLALLPDGRTTVSIDNVNHRKNEQYFLKSDFLHLHDADFWRAHPKMGMRAQLFQFDGFTVLLPVKVKLKRGKTYHFKIAIADVGDRIYDSAVLIKANSLASKGKKIPQANQLVKAYVAENLNQWQSDYLSLEKDSLSFNLNIQFNTNEAKILKESIEELNDLVNFLNQLKTLNVLVIGHTDDVGEEKENMELSMRRATSVQEYLVNQGVDADRLSISAKGETELLIKKTDEKSRFLNRRVEFRLSY